MKFIVPGLGLFLVCFVAAAQDAPRTPDTDTDTDGQWTLLPPPGPSLPPWSFAPALPAAMPQPVDPHA
ncbi:MAG TPA: hypothetical protein VMR62_24090, partial [Bryobacteraceae bacterium]|nr:hypothetical protein [Bryobacteraceae bacterium]